MRQNIIEEIQKNSESEEYLFKGLKDTSFFSEMQESIGMLQQNNVSMGEEVWGNQLAGSKGVSLRELLDQNLKQMEEHHKAMELRMEGRIEECGEEVQKQCAALREAVEAELRKRSRRENDFVVERTKMQSSIVTFQAELDNVLNKVAISIESLNFLRELLRMQACMNRQDELDKQGVALYGHQAQGQQQDSTYNPGQS